MTVRTMLHAFTCLAAALAVVGPGRADTIHVNAACGDDAWTGQSANCVAPNGPKQSIKAAVGAATNGDLVLVADGLYIGDDNRDVSFGGKSIRVESANGPAACIIDRQGFGRAFRFANHEPPTATLRGFTIRNGHASLGGAVLVQNGARPTIIDCRFENCSGDVGGAMRVIDAGPMEVRDCTFVNAAAVGGGAMFVYESHVVIAGCRFSAGVAEVSGGAISACGGTIEVSRSMFDNCHCSFIGGAVDVCADTVFTNCAFSRNDAVEGGAMHTTGGQYWLDNCTVATSWAGFAFRGDGTVHLSNSIVWNNTPAHSIGVNMVALYSNVQGNGSSANGNMNSDPLFVQPGADDLRLGLGSPCVNAASSALLPNDVHDADGDGDTSEPLPFDLAGLARVQDGAPDIGAYEGAFPIQLPSASDDDIDEGETTILVPEGNDFNPILAPAVIVRNVDAGDDASYTVTQLNTNPRPGAGGYDIVGRALVTVSDMGGGEHLSRLFISFNASDLAGLDPADIGVARLDESHGRWVHGAIGNTQPSPGQPGPIGDRMLDLDGGPWVVSAELGDGGVYWDPGLAHGFAWMNVDGIGTFAIGVAICPADCWPGAGDGVVDAGDLQFVLSNWGEVGAYLPCDLDLDGIVGPVDLMLVLANWGACTDGDDGDAGGSDPPPIDSEGWGECTHEPCHGDLDGNGTVDPGDLAILFAFWSEPHPEPGPSHDGEAGSRTDGVGLAIADLDGDGRVDRADLRRLLSGR
ncbi:MAG: hypothetical protein KDA25_03335 [Phycisphaerales bacterium]|nr:hypothetical protein [Phycisphaerales bacterium]